MVRALQGAILSRCLLKEACVVEPFKEQTWYRKGLKGGRFKAE